MTATPIKPQTTASQADKISNEDSSIDLQKDKTVLISIISLAGITLSFILYFVVVTTFFKTPNDSNGFGDTFGGLNTIFSGLAFIALVNALFMQSKELSLQREELQETQRLMADQKGEMVRQAETMHLQQFESTFFQLLNQQRKILELVSVQGLGRSPSVRGLEAIQVLEQVLNAIILTPRAAIDNIEGRNDLKIEFERLNGIFQSVESGFAHYFRHLYTLVKFVNNAEINDKHFYTGIIRAQLSSAEISILFFNGLSTPGSKFKPLIEEYCLLQHLRWRGVTTAWTCFYQRKAFFPKDATREDVELVLDKAMVHDHENRSLFISSWNSSKTKPPLSTSKEHQRQ